jgi:Na+-driven multidrug efflux pump
MATGLILVGAVVMPFDAYALSTYFTLRSGGQTMVTFLFDSCFVWGVCIPLAYCLSRFTNLSIIPLFAICVSTDLVKCVIGASMIKKGKWIQNLTV